MLATIGLWTVQERLAYSVHCTNQDADCPGPVARTRYMPDGTQYKFCSSVVHSDKTMLPIAMKPTNSYKSWQSQNNTSTT